MTAYYRTVTYDLPKDPAEVLEFELRTLIISGATVFPVGTIFSETTPGDGEDSISLACADNTGTNVARYRVTIGGQTLGIISLIYDAASASLAELLAASATELPADAITTLVNGLAADVTAHTSDTVDPHATSSRLVAATSIGATSITISVPPLWLRAGHYVIIDAMTVQAELRQIATVSLSTGTVTFTDALDYAHASGDEVLVMAAPVVFASWFGAAGDDSTDDTAALTLMLDQLEVTGGLAYAPHTYKTTLPILIRSKTTLDLCGSGMIHNTSGTATTGTCVFLGLHHPVLNDDYTWSSLSDITAGDMSITFSTPAQASRLVAGEAFFIRSAAFYRDENRQKPQVLEINRARAIDANTGIVTLDYPVGQNVTSPSAAYTNGQITYQSRVSYICDRGVFRNGRVKSDVGNWTQRWANLDCTIENIETVRSVDFMIGSAMAHGRVRGVRGTFGDRCLEVKTGAHDSLFTDIQAFYDSGLSTGGTALLLDTGEYNRDLRFENVHIHAPGWNGTDMVTPRATRTIISGLNIYAPSATGNAIGLYSGALVPPTGNVIENFTITAGGGSNYIRIGTVNNSYTATVSGAPTTTITATGNDFNIYDPVQLTTTGMLPAPLALSTTYWIVLAGNDLQLSTTSGGSAITFTDVGSGTHTITRANQHPTGNKIRNGVFNGGASTQSILAGGGTGNVVTNNKFAGTQPGVNIQSTQFTQNLIARNLGLDGITSTTEAEQGGNHFSGNLAQDRYAGATWFCGGVTTTSSTVADTVIATMTLPAGIVVRAGDILNFVVRGHFVGEAGVKNVRLYHTAAAASISSIINYTGSGGFLVRGHYAIRSNTSADRYFSAELPDGTRTVNSSAPGSLNFSTNGMTVELRAWCAVGTDAIRFTEYKSWLTVPLS